MRATDCGHASSGGANPEPRLAPDAGDCGGVPVRRSNNGVDCQHSEGLAPRGDTGTDLRTKSGDTEGTPLLLPLPELLVLVLPMSLVLVPLLPLPVLNATTPANGDGDTEATPLLLPLPELLVLVLPMSLVLVLLLPLPVLNATTPANGDGDTEATPLLLPLPELLGGTGCP